MATWAIGDIQGCAPSFLHLLEVLGFSPSRDQLWIAGDLVNRGPDNLTVLRYLHNLGTSAHVVLGNHDLHLLAIAANTRTSHKKDTLHDVTTAPDGPLLTHWLQQQPLIHVDDRYCMTHAGLPPCWSVQQASSYAQEVQNVLRDAQTAREFFSEMYGNEPRCWSEQLQGWERLRIITNYFTRMRFIDSCSALDLKTKEGLDSAPAGYAPWFSYPAASPRKHELLFGHWAALEGDSGVASCHALDSGCVWGGQLTAMDLKTQERISIEAQE